MKKGPGGAREPARLPGAPPQPGTKVFQQEEETGRKDSGGPSAYRAEDAPHLSRTVWNSHGEPRQEGRMGLLGGEHTSVSRHFPRLTEGSPSTLREVLLDPLHRWKN